MSIPSIFISGLAALPEAAQLLRQRIIDSNCSVVAFDGEMGAGKTTLIRALAAALGVSDDVSSPTFALVNEYRDAQDRPVYHFDFYRIDSPEEAERIGAAEYFDSGYLCLVEWPTRVAGLLPLPYLEINVLVRPDESREVRFLIKN
jgi:tRNA threonylcarbamoyladenosine biosynthesis protein TsaE